VPQTGKAVDGNCPGVEHGWQFPVADRASKKMIAKLFASFVKTLKDSIDCEMLCALLYRVFTEKNNNCWGRDI
jgi:hypothetical protein